MMAGLKPCIDLLSFAEATQETTNSTYKYDDLRGLIYQTEANGITMDYTYDSNNYKMILDKSEYREPQQKIS